MRLFRAAEVQFLLAVLALSTGACIGLYLKEKRKAARSVFAHYCECHNFNYDNRAAKLSENLGPKRRHMDESR